jgi:hypothetical protein
MFSRVLIPYSFRFEVYVEGALLRVDTGTHRSAWPSSVSRDRTREALWATALPSHLSHFRRVRLFDASRRQQADDGLKRDPDEDVDVRGWARVRGDMPANRRQGRLEDGVRHDADRSRIVPAAEPPTERPDFGLDLPPELLSSATQRWRPSAIDEVLPAMEQEEAGFAWVLAHPLRHVQGGRQTGMPRGGRQRAVRRTRPGRRRPPEATPPPGGHRGRRSGGRWNRSARPRRARWPRSSLRPGHSWR